MAEAEEHRAEQVLRRIEATLRPTERSAGARLAEHVEQLRAQLRHFRAEPYGGRLLALKKLGFSLTASAFDRRAKVDEALLALVEEVIREQTRCHQEQEARLRRLERQMQELAGSQPATASTASGTDAPQLLGLGRLLAAPAQLLVPERLLLYTLTYSLQPQRVLEIGTCHGGSALILCAALDDLGNGRLVCVDPQPEIADSTWQAIEHRAALIEEGSPACLPRAAELAGGPFDLAFIDGDHSRAGALADIEGTLPLLAPEAYLLFHDCHYFEVAEAIDEALARHSGLQDCGILSTAENVQEGAVVDGHQVVWGGLRLLRWSGGT